MASSSLPSVGSTKENGTSFEHGSGGRAESLDMAENIETSSETSAGNNETRMSDYDASNESSRGGPSNEGSLSTPSLASDKGSNDDGNASEALHSDTDNDPYSKKASDEKETPEEPTPEDASASEQHSCRWWEHRQTQLSMVLKEIFDGVERAQEQAELDLQIWTKESSNRRMPPQSYEDPSASQVDVEEAVDFLKEAEKMTGRTGEGKAVKDSQYRSIKALNDFYEAGCKEFSDLKNAEKKGRMIDYWRWDRVIAAFRSMDQSTLEFLLKFFDRPRFLQDMAEASENKVKLEEIIELRRAMIPDWPDISYIRNWMEELENYGVFHTDSSDNYKVPYNTEEQDSAQVNDSGHSKPNDDVPDDWSSWSE